MIKNKFNSEISTEIIDLETEQIAKLDTEDGLSSHKKFILMSLPKYSNEHSCIVFQNVTDKEKEKLFDVLDAEMHDITYTDLEEQVDKLHFQNEKLREEVEEIKMFI